MPMIDVKGVSPDEQWTSRETEEFLQLGFNTLPAWRHRGWGPKWKKSDENGHVTYRVGDVAAWLRSAPWTRVHKKERAAA